MFCAGILLAGCGGPTPDAETATHREKPAPPAADPWVLTCNDPNEAEPALLWNGLIGIRIGRDGTGMGADGKPLPFFAIDEYESTGEEKIRTLPNPLAVSLTVNGVPLQIDQSQPYQQTVSMKTGIMTTIYQAQGNDGLEVSVKVVTAINPSKRAVGSHWELTSNKAGNLILSPASDLPKPQLGTPFRYGGMKVGFRLRSSAPESVYGPIDKEVALSLVANQKSEIDRTCVLSRSSSLKNGLPSSAEEVDLAQGAPFNDIVQASEKVWARRWNTDIEIDGPVEDQQAIHSFLFYLRSAIHPSGGMSISPYGLSNSTYFGHVFWDADTWVFPALAFIDPDEARAIVDYRGMREKAAKENYAVWLKAGRPTGGKALGPAGPPQTDWPGAMFPWESSVSGHETVPGTSRFEHHITGSVYRAVTMAHDLGLIGDFSHNASPFPDVDQMWIARGACQFYLDRITKGKDGLYDLKGTMSPDENHIGDNDLYTNILAQEVIDDAWWKVPAKDRPKLRLPEDGKTFLTYDGDPLKGYKQAAAVLAIYPLQYPPAEKQAKAMMDRFADKVSKNGPAMSDSIHSVIWARIGEKEKAYQAWRDSWVPFNQGPLGLFSEKRSRQTTYFTTGAAGSLQSVIYGFLGFRLDYQKEPGAAWATRLATNKWLSIKPNLPPQWNSVKFKNFNVLGHRFTLTVTKTAATVAPGE